MYLGDIITRQSSDFFYIIQLNTGPFMKNQNHIVSEMLLAISFNKRLLTVCNISLKAFNYLKACWKHKSSETAENLAFIE